jgi:hypothetical protein
MKSEGEKMNKRRKEREEKESHGKPGRRNREKKKKEKKKKRMGSGPLIMILYRLLSHLYVFPINLVRNPLPVDVSIVD